jgi:hypothetical protein
MADFLTRLAERTLGVVPVVQPSIAPMFAPGRNIHGDGASNVEASHGSQFIAPSAPNNESLEEADLVQTIPARETRRTYRQPHSMFSSSTRQNDLPPTIAKEPLSSISGARPTPHHHIVPHPLQEVDAEVLGVAGRESNSFTLMPVSHPEPTENFPFSTQTTGESREEFLTERTDAEQQTGKEQQVLDSSNSRAALHGQFIAPKISSQTLVKPGKPSVEAVRAEVALGSPSTEAVNLSMPSLITQEEQETLPESPSAGIVASPIHSLVPQEARRATQWSPLHPALPPPVLDEATSRKASTNNLPIKAVHDPVGMTASQATATAPANASIISTPTIKVTIGRIEVRANPPAPPPTSPPRPRPTRPDPAISLNDYLKQYNGRQG